MNKYRTLDWVVPFLEVDSREWVWQDGILMLADAGWQSQEEGLFFYNSIDGVEQGNLASNPTHASHYDQPRYMDLIEQAISIAGREVNLALDLGCGDGRGTRMLLDAGMPHILAIDFHLPSLRRLVSRLTPDERDRVVPMLAPVTTEPIAGLHPDLVICVEVLTTLPDPNIGLGILRKWVEPGRGTALIVEPAVEGSLAYALIDGDLKVLERILEHHRRLDRVSGHSWEVHLRTEESLAGFLRSGGFDILAQRRVPAGAALSLLSLKRSGRPIERVELELVKLADSLEDFAPRMHAAVARVSHAT